MLHDIFDIFRANFLSQIIIIYEDILLELLARTRYVPKIPLLRR